MKTKRPITVFSTPIEAKLASHQYQSAPLPGYRDLIQKAFHADGIAIFRPPARGNLATIPDKTSTACFHDANSGGRCLEWSFFCRSKYTLLELEMRELRC